MNLRFETFTTQAAAGAVGVSAKAVSTWADKGLIVGVRNPGTKGISRNYNFGNIMQMAVALALLDAGVHSVAGAFRAAATFAYAGHGPRDEEGGMERAPALPYDFRSGTTWLVVSGEVCAVFLVAERAPENFSERIKPRPVAFCAVNLSAVFEAVCGRIGVDYRDAFDVAMAPLRARPEYQGGAE